MIILICYLIVLVSLSLVTVAQYLVEGTWKLWDVSMEKRDVPKNTGKLLTFSCESLDRLLTSKPVCAVHYHYYLQMCDDMPKGLGTWRRGERPSV